MSSLDKSKCVSAHGSACLRLVEALAVVCRRGLTIVPDDRAAIVCVLAQGQDLQRDCTARGRASAQLAVRRFAGRRRCKCSASTGFEIAAERR